MNLHQLWMIVKSRRWLGIGLFVMTLLVTLVVNLILPREYTASSTLVLDISKPDPILGVVLPTSQSYLATQAEVMTSDRVSLLVIDRLKLDKNPAVIEMWRDAGSPGNLRDWLSQFLKRGLNVLPAQGNVLEVAYRSRDAQLAAELANAYVQAFMDTNVALRTEPAQLYSRRFAEQETMLRRRLESSQRALSEFQQKNGIVAADERMDFETSKLNELSAQLTAAQLQGKDAISKGRSAGETLPEVMQNPVINQLRSDIARAEQRLLDLQSSAGENHPQVRSLRAQISSLRQSLALETGRVGRAVGTTGQISDYKVADLLAAFDAQKQRVLELKKQRDQIQVLQMDVNSAQRALDEVSKRIEQTSLEAQSAQTDISVLTPAIPPTDASHPRIYFNAFIGFFLGIVLGITGIVLREMVDRRLRSSVDLLELAGVPVLTEISSVRSVARRRFALPIPHRFKKLKGS